MEKLLDGKSHKWWQQKSKKWTAGSTIEEAVSCARKYNKQGYRVIINSIADVANNQRDIDVMKKKYIELIKAIKKNNLNAAITVRLSNLGMKFSKVETKKSLEEILKAGNQLGVNIEIDMEERPFVEDAIQIALELADSGYAFRLCVQSGIINIIKQVKRIIKASKNNITFRIVTGSCYPETLELDEPGTIKQYFQLIDICGNTSAVGTHVTERVLCANTRGLETQVLLGFENSQPKHSVDTVYACFGDWKTNVGIRGYIKRRENSE